jgi:hemolysin activation/secretion protein
VRFQYKLKRLRDAALAVALPLAGAGQAHAEPQAAIPPERCAATSEACFVLMALTIDGVSAYPLKDLAPLYADYLTREVSMTDLARIAQAITDKYRADGYFLARAVVPAQSGPEGIVRIVVYEGHVSQMQVSGRASGAVRVLLDGITDARPLRLTDLDRRLTLATDRPGLKLKSQLEPVLEDPAQHRLLVEADRQLLTGSFYLDNRGTESAGPWQAYGRIAANSTFTGGDQLAASMLTVPEDPEEFTQGEISYLYPLRTGGSLTARASMARAQDGSSNLGSVFGNENRAVNLRLTHPLSRGRSHAVWGAVGFDATQVEQDWGSIGGYEDNLRVLRASVLANRQGPGRATTAFAQISRGLDVLGATDNPGPGRSRWNADGQFWKLNLHGSHYRDLGRRAGVYLQADAQWSPDPLLASEEFAAGALPYGRAYNYAEIAGESGAGGLLELRYGFDPKARPLSFFQVYAFADAAKVWRKDAPAGFKSAALSSAGVGTRLTFNKATLRLEAAKPLTRTPYAAGDKEWRAFVALSAAF